MKKILFGGVAALILVACQAKNETETFVDTIAVDTIKADTIIVAPDSIDSSVVDSAK
jgi:uncharacterized lipoprotein YajG